MPWITPDTDTMVNGVRMTVAAIPMELMPTIAALVERLFGFLPILTAMTLLIYQTSFFTFRRLMTKMTLMKLKASLWSSG